MVDNAFLLAGLNAYESALLALMERIVADYQAPVSYSHLSTICAGS